MMDTSSTRRMSSHNRTRALIRIVKELQYIAGKSSLSENRRIRQAIWELTMEVQDGPRRRRMRLE